MFDDILRKMNIKTKTLLQRYSKLVDEKTAIIMACVEGDQKELIDSILEVEKSDQQILMEETFKHLAPRQELYPDEIINIQQSSEPIPFALDDFVDTDES